MHAITITHEVEDDYFHEIMLIACEGAIDYWVSRRNLRDGILHLTVPDYDGDEPTEFAVTQDDVATAIGKILSEYGGQDPTAVVSYLHRAVARNDLGDVDWDVADMVIQFAAMGELVFG